ncbi:MAG TPA: cytidylate kinase-like family protein [Candidatus Baltobacteraceae bacterium]|nr:cytidylate kinase-like family protein [Candidatus Baltobacteraceae bacterium]
MVITISNRYGCGAIAIAHIVADRLGYAYVDEQLPVVVAKRLMTSASAVDAAEDSGTTMSERMLRALESGTPEVRAQLGATFDEECLREVQEAVREYASRGDAVIIGRGANAILGRRPGVLRVYMHAPRDWRIHHIMEGHRVDEKTAAAEAERIDRARTEYMRAHYGLTWNDPANYDVCIDTSSFDRESCAAIIVRAVEVR